jgi:hypothetical protein
VLGTPLCIKNTRVQRSRKSNTGVRAPPIHPLALVTTPGLDIAPTTTPPEGIHFRDFSVVHTSQTE